MLRGTSAVKLAEEAARLQRGAPTWAQDIGPMAVSASS
jgi:hypothetical protein